MKIEDIHGQCLVVSDRNAVDVLRSNLEWWSHHGDSAYGRGRAEQLLRELDQDRERHQRHHVDAMLRKVGRA